MHAHTDIHSEKEKETEGEATEQTCLPSEDGEGKPAGLSSLPEASLGNTG